uniref:Uncharacterized protein n=1 Tax=Arundo donax TaxID=35708 RepID=A0A0A8XTF6_ARUDO
MTTYTPITIHSFDPMRLIRLDDDEPPLPSVRDELVWLPPTVRVRQQQHEPADLIEQIDPSVNRPARLHCSICY